MNDLGKCGNPVSPTLFLNRLINICSFIYSRKYRKYKNACQKDNWRKL